MNYIKHEESHLELLISLSYMSELSFKVYFLKVKFWSRMRVIKYFDKHVLDHWAVAQSEHITSTRILRIWQYWYEINETERFE